MAKSNPTSKDLLDAKANEAQLDFRAFIDLLREDGDLAGIEHEIDPHLELARSFGIKRGAMWKQICARTQEAKSSKPLPPNVLPNEPYKENKIIGDIDLHSLPVSKQHQEDGSKYIQTYGVHVLQTPDKIWTNWSIFSGMARDKNHIVAQVNPRQHKYVVKEKWRALGKIQVPWVLALGIQPAATLAAAMLLPEGVSEGEYVGALAGEIMVEGYMSLEAKAIEDPYGDYMGYDFEYDKRMQPLLRVEVIIYRNNPIFPVSVHGKITDESHTTATLAAAEILTFVQAHDLPIKDTNAPLETMATWPGRDEYHFDDKPALPLTPYQSHGGGDPTKGGKSLSDYLFKMEYEGGLNIFKTDFNTSYTDEVQRSTPNTASTILLATPSLKGACLELRLAFISEYPSSGFPILHRYLSDFARHFGVPERTQLNTSVQHPKRDSNDEWDLILRVRIKGAEAEQAIHTRRLIVALCLSSQPNLPIYTGEDSFTGKKSHAKDFCRYGETTETAKRVIIVGGGKSAYDCTHAYAAAAEGDNSAHVDILIRPHGQGPVWLVSTYVTPFKRKMEELLHTRGLTWFAPSAWGEEDGYAAPRAWLQKSVIGRLITSNWFATSNNEVIETHGFDHHPELFKLKPWQPIFWTGSGVGIHNFDSNLWDLVRSGKMHVHIADVAKLDGSVVHLSNGTILADIDVICCATGWRKDATLTYDGLEVTGLGLPSDSTEEQSRLRQADKEVLDRFPILTNQPVMRYERKPDTEPLRYYRFIVPPSRMNKRNIAFAGMVSTVIMAMFANAQALWISAYFDGKFVREAKTQEEVLKEVYLHTQFVKWRCPCGYSDSLPDFTVEAVPYVDLLLNDLGVKYHRKATEISEILEPYKPKDYESFTREWLSLQGRQ
ncbi:putative dimethylaniline monooxygenase [Paramyrothecium foliicola]|nr:putative dimethylaniline monooxygenase [Paramyrothecium foliicola]